MRYRVLSAMTTMANLLLTQDCHRPFLSDCAGNEMSGPPGQSWSWENLIYLADFLWASNQRQVSLGGGEPTLHPECVDFILYLLHRGFEVTVFTDGVVSSPRLEEFRRHLTQAPTERLTWVCNLQDPGSDPDFAASNPTTPPFSLCHGTMALTDADRPSSSRRI